MKFLHSWVFHRLAKVTYQRWLNGKFKFRIGSATVPLSYTQENLLHPPYQEQEKDGWRTQRRERDRGAKSSDRGPIPSYIGYPAFGSRDRPSLLNSGTLCSCIVSQPLLGLLKQCSEYRVAGRRIVKHCPNANPTSISESVCAAAAARCSLSSWRCRCRCGTHTASVLDAGAQLMGD